MYVKKEALLSSQIEGTQASLIDVWHAEEFPLQRPEKGVDEIVNHVAAMNYGLARLEKLPLCLRLIREIHEILMKDVRGSEDPRRFRSQPQLGRPTRMYVGTPLPMPAKSREND